MKDYDFKERSREVRNYSHVRTASPTASQTAKRGYNELEGKLDKIGKGYEKFANDVGSAVKSGLAVGLKIYTEEQKVIDEAQFNELRHVYDNVDNQTEWDVHDTPDSHFQKVNSSFDQDYLKKNYSPNSLKMFDDYRIQRQQSVTKSRNNVKLRIEQRKAQEFVNAEQNNIVSSGVELLNSAFEIKDKKGRIHYDAGKALEKIENKMGENVAKQLTMRSDLNDEQKQKLAVELLDKTNIDFLISVQLNGSAEARKAVAGRLEQVKSSPRTAYMYDLEFDRLTKKKNRDEKLYVIENANAINDTYKDVYKIALAKYNKTHNRKSYLKAYLIPDVINSTFKKLNIDKNKYKALYNKAIERAVIRPKSSGGVTIVPT